MKKKYKIAIIGSYPPPFGGISVHIQRVVNLLRDDEYILYNTAPNNDINAVHFYGKQKLLILLSFFFKKFRLIHHHTPDKTVRLLLCFLGYFKKNIYLHIHGASLEDNFSEGSISSFLIKKMLKNVSVIADNSRILKIAKKYNPKDIYQIDAFLPSAYNEQVYTSVIEKITLPKAEIIISMVGWFTEFRDTDLYGYDLLPELLHRLRGEYNLDVAIVASVNGIISENIHNRFINRVSEFKMEEYISLITDEMKEIWPIYLRSDIFIRPTISDGSSVALLEAMWFEAKTIASDAVPRPDNVVLFKDRDVNDLVDKIRLIIEKGFLSGKERLNNIKNKKFKSKLMKEIYKIER